MVVETTITDKVYGCIIGGAIGDALGAPLEGWPYHRIRSEYGTVDTFLPRYDPSFSDEPGSISDDSIVRHYHCLAIIEHGRRITPDEFAETLLEYLRPKHVWIPEEIAYRKLQAGINPWIAGRGTVPSVGAAMGIAPIGIINAADPRQAYQDAFNIASVTQDYENRDAAAMVAAGVAEAFSPGATLETVIEAMLTHSTETVFRACNLTLNLASESNTLEEFTSNYYDSMLDWTWPSVEWDSERYKRGEIFSANSLEVVPVVMAILDLCNGDPNVSIIAAANFGRDSDSIATLTGNIVGALAGASHLRQEWIDECEKANRPFFEEMHDDSIETFQDVADHLVAVLSNERERASQREAELETIFEGS